MFGWEMFHHRSGTNPISKQSQSGLLTSSHIPQNRGCLVIWELQVRYAIMYVSVGWADVVDVRELVPILRAPLLTK